jgi:hypothetical protein
MKQKNIGISCKSEALKGEMVLEGHGVNFLAVVQALQFAVENKELFQKTVSECEDCFEMMEYSREYIAGMITAVIEHQKEHQN